MKKTLNKDTGEVTFSFTDKEIKKLKIIPHLGRNEIFWEPTDLPGQVLLYHMKLGNWPLSPGAQNGMRGKVVWHP